jgi:hypothetical protein
MPRTVCVDFDGVCSDYHGWRGADVLDLPRPGLREFLLLLREAGYETVIHTTRPAHLIVAWLEAHELDTLVAHVTATKPPAVAYLDDRGICFRGDYGEAFNAILSSKAYWEEG